MKTSDFLFDLPRELIAQHPPEIRGSSRLMVLAPRIPEPRAAAEALPVAAASTDRRLQPIGQIEHRTISDLPDLIEPGSVMVINNSKVRRARIFGRSDTGGRTEFLLVERLPNNRWSAMVSRARKHRTGKHFHFADGVSGTIEGQDGVLRIISFDKPVNEDWLERYGHVPLPPYIERQDEGTDADRYQTVYADPSGSVAAPTAGLHLTEKLLERIRARAVDIETVTLHVGIGTFLPIRSGTIEEHAMHKESYEVPERTAEAVTAARKAGRPIVAVGTTSVRTLESAWQGRELRAGKGVTALYIVPGYRFRAVDALLTNFHTPGSTLLVLVSAFAGADFVRRAYGEAIRERYRFFSYGDAMFIRSAASGRPP